MDRWCELFLDGTACAESDTLQCGAQRAGALRGSYPGYLWPVLAPSRCSTYADRRRTVGLRAVRPSFRQSVTALHHVGVVSDDVTCSRCNQTPASLTGHQSYATTAFLKRLFPFIAQMNAFQRKGSHYLRFISQPPCYVFGFEINLPAYSGKTMRSALFPTQQPHLAALNCPFYQVYFHISTCWTACSHAEHPKSMLHLNEQG